MSKYVLSFNPGAPGIYPHGAHNTSAVILDGGELVFGVEEERFTREKHGYHTFPEQSIRACLDHCGIELSDVDEIVLPWDTDRVWRRFPIDFKRALYNNDSLLHKLYYGERVVEEHLAARTIATNVIRKVLVKRFGEPVPSITTRQHHACHAASAFYPSGFEKALILTVDGYGECESTVVWLGDQNGLERVRIYDYPNSLGHFYRITTTFLGYAPATRSEGKIMGLAPYGSFNEEIEQMLDSIIQTGLDYDVTGLTEYGVDHGVQILEELTGRLRKGWAADFTQWEKDLAFMTQRALEETVVSITSHYCKEYDFNKVALAGGVALNCKLNKRVMESEPVDEVFIQPVAHDGGIAIGGAMQSFDPRDVPELETVYLGPKYTNEEIKNMLDTNKIEYQEPDDVPRFVAERLANGELVGWFQGRLEMGPRALGNRSILADPRTEDSRDRVNEFVKHREPWRPFAPSIIEAAVDRYLENGESSPYMIKTFDTLEKTRDEIRGVLHPGDQTTRPHTVRKERNHRYYQVIREFEKLTGVPVVLNTSFNDSGEPIVNTPMEALRDFYAMGLDVLALEDIVIKK